MDFSQFSSILQERCHIYPGQKLLVGVSGGSDSMCLLHLLKQLDYDVTAAHLDHKIRMESGRDADFIRDMCQSWQIPCVIRQYDVLKWCDDHHMNLEEGARNLRYEFLHDRAKEIHASAILIGHHADDQVETVLMHFIRGAGLAGLKGMEYRTLLLQYSDEIPLVRPLLSFTKPEILKYCLENNIPFVQDQTNVDTTFFRNRLRHELIPELETYNPRFRDVIIRMVDSLQADNDTLFESTEKVWKSILLEQEDQYVRLDLHKLKSNSRGQRWNVFRRAVRDLRPELRDFDHAVLSRLDEFVCHPAQPKTIDLVGNLEARLDENSLWITEKGFHPAVLNYPQYDGDALGVKAPFEIKLVNGWMMFGETVEREAFAPEVIMNAPKNEAWLDVDKLEGSIQIRNPAPGDRIQPLGSHGHHSKVSDQFINHNIPRNARPAYPVLCDSNKIIWLPGIMISEMCKVTDSTKKMLHLKILEV